MQLKRLSDILRRIDREQKLEEIKGKNKEISGRFPLISKFKRHTDESWFPFFNEMTEWEGENSILGWIVCIKRSYDDSALNLRLGLW
jgi:hypothetical protein